MNIFTMLFITVFTFLIGLLLIGIGTKIYVSVQMKRLRKDWGNKEYILEGGEKKALVLYHPSKHNTADKLNRLLAEALHKRKYEVTVNYLCQGQKYCLDEYDIISLGSPVYMGKISSLLMEYLEQKNPSGKKLIFFITGMLPDSIKEFEEVKKKAEKKNMVFCIKAVVNEPEEIEEMIKKIEV